MDSSLPVHADLPEGWYSPNDELMLRLHSELQRELPRGHLLAGRAVETFAWTEGSNDDVLFRNLDDADRFTVIHLSWRSRRESDPRYPLVEFDGTFRQFVFWTATRSDYGD